MLTITREADHTYTTVILRCFVVRIWFKIPSNNALHYFLSVDTAFHRRIIKSCGLHALPDRRTFDRRFKVIPVQNMICMMGRRFLREGIVESYVGAADSAIISCKKVWHNSDIRQGRIPASGIDTDARWGFSKSKGWVFATNYTRAAVLQNWQCH